jgi:hypothetical protein
MNESRASHPDGPLFKPGPSRRKPHRPGRSTSRSIGCPRGFAVDGDRALAAHDASSVDDRVRLDRGGHRSDRAEQRAPGLSAQSGREEAIDHLAGRVPDQLGTLQRPGDRLARRPREKLVVLQAIQHREQPRDGRVELGRGRRDAGQRDLLRVLADRVGRPRDSQRQQRRRIARWPSARIAAMTAARRSRLRRATGGDEDGASAPGPRASASPLSSPRTECVGRRRTRAPPDAATYTSRSDDSSQVTHRRACLLEVAATPTDETSGSVGSSSA